MKNHVTVSLIRIGAVDRHRLSKHYRCLRSIELRPGFRDEEQENDDDDEEDDELSDYDEPDPVYLLLYCVAFTSHLA